MEKSKLEELQLKSMHNSHQVMNSHKCGCYNCLQTFRPYSVVSWCDNNDPEGATALCPYCGTDSVLGDACGEEITDNLLTEMNNEMFDGEPYYLNIKFLREQKRMKDEVKALIASDLPYSEKVDAAFDLADEHCEEGFDYDILSEVADSLSNTQKAPVFYDFLLSAASYCEYYNNSSAAMYFLKQAEPLIESSEHSEFINWKEKYCSFLCRISDHCYAIGLKDDADMYHHKAYAMMAKMPPERRYSDVFRLAAADKEAEKLHERNESDKAIEIYDEVISVLESEKCDKCLRPLMARFIYLKANVCYDLNNIVLAEQLFLKAHELFKEMEDLDYLLSISQVECCCGLGNLYEEIGDKTNAIRFYNEANNSVECIPSWHRISKATQLRMRALDALGRLYDQISSATID